MSLGNPIIVHLEQEHDFSFRVRFEGASYADLITDEPAPLGGDAGPNPSRLLLAALANCLSASLLFALRKFHNTPVGLRASIQAQTVRDESGRWRIPRAEVVLRLPDAAAGYQNLERILDQFENFCVVTQSVRAGIEVGVRIEDGTGAVLRG